MYVLSFCFSSAGGGWVTRLLLSMPAKANTAASTGEKEAGCERNAHRGSATRQWVHCAHVHRHIQEGSRPSPASVLWEARRSAFPSRRRGCGCGATTQQRSTNKRCQGRYFPQHKAQHRGCGEAWFRQSAQQHKKHKEGKQGKEMKQAC